MKQSFHHRQISAPVHPVKRVLFSPIGLLLWVGICLFISVGLWQSVGEMRKSLLREQQAKQKLNETEQKTLELIDKLNQADTPLSKEKIIRDELQMQKPDETVIQIPKQN